VISDDEEEYRLIVCKNKVLRKIFAPNGGDVIGEWRRLHHEELASRGSGGQDTWKTCDMKETYKSFGGKA
jgi:hypothetical protein